MIKFIFTLITIITTAAFSVLAFALNFNQVNHLYFFGDSLSDSGFNDLWSTDQAPIPLPPGKAPTSTTYGGYTWVQYLAHDIKGNALPQFPGPVPQDTITNNTCCVVAGFSSGKLNGFNYAASGSTTDSTGQSLTWAPSLSKQITTFLATPNLAITPNDVFFIWAGANDILKAAAEHKDIRAAQLQAATNIANEVNTLIQHGAKHIIVLSLPNLALTPLIEKQDNEKISIVMKLVSLAFNSNLNKYLGLINKPADVNITLLDVTHKLEEVIHAAQNHQPYIYDKVEYDFVNTRDPVCGNNIPALFCTNTSKGYVFADDLHPSDLAHQLLARLAEDAVKAC